MFTELSGLRLELDGTCQSLAVRVSSVGAQGDVTSVAYIAQPSAALYLSEVAVTVSPEIEVLDDAVKSVHRQGLSFSLYPMLLTTTAAPPGFVLLALHLPPAPYYSGERE